MCLGQPIDLCRAQDLASLSRAALAEEAVDETAALLEAVCRLASAQLLEPAVVDRSHKELAGHGESEEGRYGAEGGLRVAQQIFVPNHVNGWRTRPRRPALDML